MDPRGVALPGIFYVPPGRSPTAPCVSCWRARRMTHGLADERGRGTLATARCLSNSERRATRVALQEAKKRQVPGRPRGAICGALSFLVEPTTSPPASRSRTPALPRVTAIRERASFLEPAVRKLAHFSSWLAVGFLLHALVGCGCFKGWTDQGIQDFVGGAQSAAVATGQAWAVPVIGGLGALATAVLHVVKGVPGVPAIPGTRAHRKRAVRRAQREAASGGAPKP